MKSSWYLFYAKNYKNRKKGFTFSVDPEIMTVPEGFIAREYILSLLPLSEEAKKQKKKNQ